MNKLPVALISMLLQIAVVWFVPMFHSSGYIIGFFCLLLLIGVVVQESREDMLPRQKMLVGGFVWGTYAAAIIMSVAVYRGWLALSVV